MPAKIQGLCVSGEWADDEGDGLFRMLGVPAEPCGDRLNACAMEHPDGGVPPQRHDGRTLADVNQARILAEPDILVAVQPVLDCPMPPFEQQHARWRALLRAEARDAVVERPLGTPVFPPRPFEAEDLGHARPSQAGGQAGRHHEFPDLRGPAVPRLHRPRHPSIPHGQRSTGRRGIKEQLDGAVERALGLLDQHDRVPARRADLAANRALAEQGVAGPHPAAPVDLGGERRSDRQLRLGFGSARRARDRLVRKDAAVVVAESAQGMHRTAPRWKPEPAALGFPVAGDALESAIRRGGHDARSEAGGAGRGQRLSIEVADEPRPRRLPERSARGEAQRDEEVRPLASAPPGPRTDSGLARRAATARARMAGSGETTPPARRGSGTAAKAAAKLVGETDSGRAPETPCGAPLRRVNASNTSILSKESSSCDSPDA